MNLIELQKQIEATIERVRERGESPENVPVTLQLAGDCLTVWGSGDIKVVEDNNTQATGCVICAEIGGTD